jgi:hypothetical protein
MFKNKKRELAYRKIIYFTNKKGKKFMFRQRKVERAK